MPAMTIEGDLLHIVRPDDIPTAHKALGRWLLHGAGMAFLAVAALQALDASGLVAVGFETWRPLLYAYILWAVALCMAQVLVRGEQGKRALFVVSMVVFPPLFGITIAFSDWNLASLTGRKFNGLDNFRQMWADPFYWNALGNMVWYVLAIAAEYAIAFGLALLLNAEIRARNFFRVAMLMPLMLSPVAVSWMVGKSMLEIRFAPLASFARWLGWDNPAFFSDPNVARAMIMAMDGRTWIPLMVAILLAGLQSLDREVLEAARVDGANRWQGF